MERTTVFSQLQTYIAQNLLEGMDVGLDENTPLLEWGVINSLEIVRLLAFIQQEFQLDVPNEKIVASNFTNLSTITDLVMESREVHADK